MSLRRAVPEQDAQYEDPILGVNLRSSQEDLRPGESPLMQNCIYLGGIRNRTGSQRLNSTALATNLRIRGGHKFYYGGSSPTKKRLIAYGTKVSVLSDTGVETVLTSGMTNDKDTQFLTWSITDRVYICNGVDTLRQYDGTTFSTVTGTSIPTARWLAPIADRLMAITTAGIERCNPRDPTVWSANSSWATLRPSRVGLFTCIHPVSLRGLDSINSGLLAFQPNSYYLVTGTNFGDNVAAASPPAGEDSRIQLLDSAVGTSSPYSVVSIPGVGTAWFTSDFNVYLLPEGSLRGMYIGDKLKSTGATVGLESTANNFLDQVWMAYFDRFLMLGIPTGADSYTTVQYWMDLYSWVLYPDRGPVWYGPMTGQSLSRVWVENQQSDFAIYGGEGNPANNTFVYQLRVPARYTDAVGLNDNPISMIYQTPYPGFGAPSKLKYLRSVHFDLSFSSGSPTCNVLDLDGTLLSGATISSVSN
jgi:hypothetical protein